MHFLLNLPTSPNICQLKLPPRRRDPAERAAAIEILEQQKQKEKEDFIKAKDVICDYLELMYKKETSKYVDRNLLSCMYEHKSENSVYLFKFNFDGNNVPDIRYSIRVKEGLYCDVFYEKCALNNSEIFEILGSEKKM